MLDNQNIEQKIEKNLNQTRLLELQMEAQDKEIAEFLREMKVTPKQLANFVENPDNFTPENWEELQKQRKLLDEKLNKDLKNISNPLKTKKAYKERQVDPRWLFVR